MFGGFLCFGFALGWFGCLFFALVNTGFIFGEWFLRGKLSLSLSLSLSIYIYISSHCVCSSDSSVSMSCQFLLEEWLLWPRGIANNNNNINRKKIIKNKKDKKKENNKKIKTKKKSPSSPSCLGNHRLSPAFPPSPSPLP